MTTDKFHMVAIDLETMRALEDSRPATLRRERRERRVRPIRGWQRMGHGPR